MKENMDNKRKGVWSSGRLTIGIISIVLFLFIALQSCAVGVGNALQENNSTSGSSGLLCAFVYLVGGILGIVMRNAKGIAGLIVTAVFYLLGFLMSLADRGEFGDLGFSLDEVKEILSEGNLKELSQRKLGELDKKC